ncbi:hypothetical protein HK103_004738 [Boothiomyces macroporosus]|uniref:t-SNARE coiled-coil homology domain-containing protein n=1 Tax=Boothiomyces macroporosus TaxID=261099 RepID=A0AAD5UPL9_9FUNG|nr:hypothetical protein HK103_004738 [Boothiomyces macroporosus]
MSSMRDAHKRLEVIYKACAPQAQEDMAAEAGLDEFTRLKKKVHTDMKAIREALKDREAATKSGGTTTESAEASYRIRVMIKSVKEAVTKMEAIYDKEAKKKKPKDPAKVAEHKEIVQLCKQHIEEVEHLEKRRIADAHAGDRVELLNGAANNNLYANMGKDLPDIDAEEDMKAIKNRNKEIDEEVHQLGQGVAKLKDIAIDMGQELDRQNENLERIDKKVEANLDHVDNINVSLKKALDGVMKGDKFMVNCVLLCVLLALAAFISSQFLSQ